MANIRLSLLGFHAQFPGHGIELFPIFSQSLARSPQHTHEVLTLPLSTIGSILSGFRVGQRSGGRLARAGSRTRTTRGSARTRSGACGRSSVGCRRAPTRCGRANVTGCRGSSGSRSGISRTCRARHRRIGLGFHGVGITGTAVARAFRHLGQQYTRLLRDFVRHERFGGSRCMSKPAALRGNQYYTSRYK
jgi:hypothetical protein